VQLPPFSCRLNPTGDYFAIKNFAPTKVAYTSVLLCQGTFDATNGRGSQSGWQLGVHHEKLVTVFY